MGTGLEAVIGTSDLQLVLALAVFNSNQTCCIVARVKYIFVYL